MFLKLSARKMTIEGTDGFLKGLSCNRVESFLMTGFRGILFFTGMGACTAVSGGACVTESCPHSTSTLSIIINKTKYFTIIFKNKKACRVIRNILQNPRAPLIGAG